MHRSVADAFLAYPGPGKQHALAMYTGSYRQKVAVSGITAHCQPVNVALLQWCRARLHIVLEGQAVVLDAGALAPDDGRDGAEHAQRQLQQDDKHDLEVQEVVVRACRARAQQSHYSKNAKPPCRSCAQTQGHEL